MSYMHRYFYLFGLDFGTYLHYLMFYAHVSPITLGLACSGSWLQMYRYQAKCKEKTEKLRPTQVKGASKTSPIGLWRMIQGKTRKPKRCTKTQQSRKMGHCRPVSTPPSPWWLPWLWQPDFCRVVSFPSRPFVFLPDFSRFMLNFSLKKMMYLAWKEGGGIHSLETLELSKNSIEEEESGRRGIRQKATGWKQIERSAF